MNKTKKRSVVVKVLLIILAVIALIVVAVALYLSLNPVFGGKASEEDRENYSKRADNFADDKFSYPENWELSGLSEDEIVSEKKTSPEGEIPVKAPEFDERPDIDKVSVTWLGHSGIMLQMHGMNILIDPVFSNRTSPVSFVGPKRFSELPVELGDLPDIDIVIISHDHYDHLDMKTVRELDEKTEKFIVPLGVENHLERWGVSAEKITNMAWWEETEIDGLTIGCTPSRHFSGRKVIDADKTLWASWVFMDEFNQIFESGDGGYGGHFEEIHNRYGDFDFAMIDCAQYNMKWHYVHMFPEESAMAAEALGAKAVMPVHWGAFVLSSHPWDDPPERFTSAAENLGLTVVTPYIGETMPLDKAQDYQERWWKNIL